MQIQLISSGKWSVSSPNKCFLKEKRSKVNQRIPPLWTNSHWSLQVKTTLVPNILQYWVIFTSPWLMEITIHRKTLFCFLDMESCHHHKTTAMLCCLDRANGLSVIKLFCSAKEKHKHVFWKSSQYLPHFQLPYTPWIFHSLMNLEFHLVPAVYSAIDLHACRLLSKELFPSASSQSCSNLIQVIKRN